MLKRMRLITGLLIVILIAGSVIYFRLASSNSDSASVAMVNGSPITVKEFKSELQRQRAIVIDYFRQSYGAEYGSDFWKTEFKGENPESAAKKRALNEAVRLKVELELAKQYGLVQGISYDDLMREMEKENQRRKAAIKEHQPIYGPVQLDESTFLNDYITKLRNELKEKLSENELKVSDADLKRYYEQVKDTLFVKGEKVKFQKITVSYREAGSSENIDQQMQIARKQANSVRQLVIQGKKMSEAAQELQAENEGLAVHYSEEELNPDTASRYFKSQPTLYSVLTNDLKKGEISNLFEEEMWGEYVVIKIMEREAMEYKSFDENKRNVWNSYMGEAYSTYLNKLVANAQIDIITKTYEGITMQ